MSSKKFTHNQIFEPIGVTYLRHLMHGLSHFGSFNLNPPSTCSISALLSFCTPTLFCETALLLAAASKSCVSFFALGAANARLEPIATQSIATEILLSIALSSFL